MILFPVVDGVKKPVFVLAGLAYDKSNSLRNAITSCEDVLESVDFCPNEAGQIAAILIKSVAGKEQDSIGYNGLLIERLPIPHVGIVSLGIESY